MSEAPRKIAHRHFSEFQALHEVSIKPDGSIVVKFKFCDKCGRVPEDGEYIGWHYE